jgi:hypothetical protein
MKRILFPLPVLVLAFVASSCVSAPKTKIAIPEYPAPYNAAPRFTVEILEAAFAQRPVFFNTTSNPGYGSQENIGSLSLFYLALAEYLQPGIGSKAGVPAKDRALEHIRNLISGGREPHCSNGPFWAHGAITSGLTMARKTPAIWNALGDAEKAKVDLVMKSLAISINWGYNDQNDFPCGLNLAGNFKKSWNPNYRCSYIPGIVNAVLYFGSADAVNEIFINFDYDRHLAALNAAGFTNIAETWANAGKTLMEEGGSVTAKDGGMGSGKGVKQPFVYNKAPLSDIDGIMLSLVQYTYQSTVKSSAGVRGGKNYAHILDGTRTPFEGMPGMLYEFASGDANGIRSDAEYCAASFDILVPAVTLLKIFGGWDGSTPAQQRMDRLMYVGNEDLIYKLEHGYHSYSKGKGADHYEYSMKHGYSIAKEVWRKALNFAEADTVIAQNPSAGSASAGVAVLAVPPQDGTGAVPQNAFTAMPYEGAFPREGMYELGKAYRETVALEFDMVFSPEIDETCNNVLAFTGQAAAGLQFKSFPILIQLSNGTINVYSGSGYVNSAFPAAANYRYHARLSINVAAKQYNVWLTPVYPQAGAETHIGKDCTFRSSAPALDSIGVLAMTRESMNGTVWVENLTVNGDRIAKK